LTLKWSDQSDDLDTLLQSLDDHIKLEIPKLVRHRLENIKVRNMDDAMYQDEMIEMVHDVIRQSIQTFKSTIAAPQSLEKSKIELSGQHTESISQTSCSRGPEVVAAQVESAASNSMGASFNQQDISALFQNVVNAPLDDFDFPLDELFTCPSELSGQVCHTCEPSEIIDYDST
jgi:hypothetical protein